MKRLVSVILFIAAALTNSSCGVLWTIHESQQNYLAPQHTLAGNNEYEVIWNKSDIQTATLLSSANKIIAEGLEKGKFSQTTIFGINNTTGEILWKIPGSIGDTIIASDNVLYRGESVKYHGLTKSITWAA